MSSYSREQQSFSNAVLARETMITQLATQADLMSAAEPRLTLGGYGMTTVGVYGREVVIDARLSASHEFVTMARAQVKASPDEFHDIDVRLGERSLIAKVHDQDGHIVENWQTFIALAMLMRHARIRSKSSSSTLLR